MTYTFLNITWAAGQYLWLSIMFGLISLLLIYRLKSIRMLAEHLSSVSLQAYMLKHFSFKRTVIKTFFVIMGLCAWFLAVLRPQWGLIDESVIQYGRDMYIALDVSRSMAAQDITPTRLERAKEKIAQLVRLLPSERIGLIIFSGSAYVFCPLTTDHNAFTLFLEMVDTQTVSSGKTALAQAIVQAEEAFAKLSEHKRKLLLLITDGEDFSENITTVYQKAVRSGIVVLTLGMATEDGAPVPMLADDGSVQGYQKDEQGSFVISRLNRDLLSQISRESEGVFVQTTDTDEDVHAIVKAVERIEQERAKSNAVVSRFQEQFWYFAVISFVLLILNWIL